MSMLLSLSQESPIAIVSAKLPRGLYFSSAWDRKTNSSCSFPQFPIAQPAALNTNAVQAMGSLHHNKGLSRLRKIWKGTHDHLLGLSLWLYDIPVFSLSKSYHTTEIPDTTYLYKSLRPGVVTGCIVFHRLRNWNYSQTTGKGIVSKTVIGQEELHNFLMSNYTRTLIHALGGQELRSNKGNIEKGIGSIARRKLFLVDGTSPHNSSNVAFAEKLKNIRDVYFDFTVNDC